MKLALLVPDGVGVRTFLHSSFLERWRQIGDVVVWHDLPDRVEALLPEAPAAGHGGVRFARLPPWREGVAERLLRLAKLHAGLFAYADRAAASLVLGFSRPRGRLRNRALHHAARLLGRVAATPAGVRRLDRRHAAAARRSPAFGAHRAALAAERPDVVFCTHQRASRAVLPMLAAQAAGVPAATFVYSWDNLPKGRMAVHAGRFLVWSEAMARELLRLHPETDPRHVRVVGTPQFEPYFERLLRRPRATFLAGLGLAGLGVDPALRVVLFSGDDLTTSPHDPLYLRDLARAVAAMPAGERPAILFRRCPPDRGDRYRAVLAEHPEIVVAEPAWDASAEGDWTQVLPRPEDRALLANLVAHCDAVVNLGSTMALDFAVAGKPAVWVAYDPVDDPAWSAASIYRLPHFAPVHRLQPVVWAASAEGLGPALRHALARPAERREAREAWIDETLARPLDGASERTVEALVEIGRARGR